MSFIGKFLSAAKSVIASTASIGNDRSKIDRDESGNNVEGKIAKEMLKGVNKSAVGLDTVEFKQLVTDEKAYLRPFVDDAEILADLMSALAESAPDLDMAKVDKYNKERPTLVEKPVADVITTSTEDGYVGMDIESFNTVANALGDDAGRVFQCMSDAIKSGRAGEIANNQISFEKDIEGANNVIKALRGEFV